MDFETYKNVPAQSTALEYAVKLLSACPRLLTDVKDMKELLSYSCNQAG
jgi:hypothetical protein